MCFAQWIILVFLVTATDRRKTFKRARMSQFRNVESKELDKKVFMWTAEYSTSLHAHLEICFQIFSYQYTKM